MPQHTVRFLPDGQSVEVERGASLLEAAAQAGIVLNDLCGGGGICGRCRVTVREGKAAPCATALLSSEEAGQGVQLACQCRVEDDLAVEIPEEARRGDRIGADAEARRFHSVHAGLRTADFQAAPLVRNVFLEMEPPTLEDNLPDVQRLQHAIEKKAGLRAGVCDPATAARCSRVLRESGFQVTVTLARGREGLDILDVAPGDTSDSCLMAVVDVGTSTVVAELVDASAMKTTGSAVCRNGQQIHGRDVIPRIMASEKNGVEALQKPIVQDINNLLSRLASENGVRREEILAVVASGNTVMSHFLLGLPADAIRRKPYVPVTVEPPPVPAASVGLQIHPRGRLYTVPGISGWVGGDITAGILATGLHEQDEIGMLIDLGTNGEIVVGNREWLVATAASAGPALEGASVKSGMMATEGAVESMRMEDGELSCRVIGGGEPKGICGSGMIDLLALLLQRGTLNRSGRFEEGTDRFVVAGTGKGEVAIDREDVENIIDAKAAVFAATKIILDRLELKLSDIRSLTLAGAFGEYMNVSYAVAIGLLPDLPPSSVRFAGNASLWGAKVAAFSEEAYDRLHEIGRKTTFFDLMGSDDYVEQFQQARFLPHTNIELFPSAAGNR